MLSLPEVSGVANILQLANQNVRTVRGGVLEFYQGHGLLVLHSLFGNWQLHLPQLLQFNWPGQTEAMRRL